MSVKILWMSINFQQSRKYASVSYDCHNVITCLFQNERLVIIHVKWANEFTITTELSIDMKKSIFAIIWASNTDRIFMMFWKKKCTYNKIFMFYFFLWSFYFWFFVSFWMSDEDCFNWNNLLNNFWDDSWNDFEIMSDFFDRKLIILILKMIKQSNYILVLICSSIRTIISFFIIFLQLIRYSFFQIISAFISDCF